MINKILIGILVLALSSILYIVGNYLYMQYQRNEHSKEYESNSYKIDKLIKNKATKDLKTNDLVFICELRKSLWHTTVPLETIQLAAEENSPKYKKFVMEVTQDIFRDAQLKAFVKEKQSEVDLEIIGSLCTLLNSKTGSSRSLYNKLLSQKYNIDLESGSLSYVDISKVTQEDLDEYLKAKKSEENIRLKF
ncbi:hypothetical protein I8T81_09100 [Acinetobacter seifertii]|uniref:hypothetical protein n=1 Tax=Acinetobacter seifertii TaxID=1530123 RepID=UPI0018DD6620|nr:hypothetical protein [Acinetobacter seifertii]QPV60949.1 hypothetical protein I8T81_09100 [Acinetobacter seifertii]